jgi:hypothetical protein
MGVQVKCDIDISYSGDTIKLTKESEENWSSLPVISAIDLLDKTFQHMRSCLTAALDKSEMAVVPVIAFVPADKAQQVQEALNK